MPKNHTLCEPGDARPTDGIEDHACPFTAGNLLHARRQIFLLRRDNILRSGVAQRLHDTFYTHYIKRVCGRD